MEISIKHELECQALLATRFVQGKVHRESYDDALDDLTYTLLDTDPMPEGMVPGEFIHGLLRLTEDSPKAEPLPMYMSTGS